MTSKSWVRSLDTVNNMTSMGTFAPIPNWLMRRSEISPRAQILYARLLQYAGQSNEAHPSIKTLARTMAITPRHLQRLLKELNMWGLIKTDLRRDEFDTSRYFILAHPWVLEPEQKSAASYRNRDRDVVRFNPNPISTKEELSKCKYSVGAHEQEADSDSYLLAPTDLPHDDIFGSKSDIFGTTSDILGTTSDILGSTTTKNVVEEEIREKILEGDHEEIKKRSGSLRDPYSLTNRSQIPDPESESDPDPDNQTRRTPDREKKRKVPPKEKKDRRSWLEKLPDLPPDPDEDEPASSPTARPALDTAAYEQDKAASRAADLAEVRAAIAASQEAAKAKKEAQLKKSSLDTQRIQNLSGKLKDGSLRSAVNSLFATWKLLMEERYPDTTVAKFGPREQNICSQLMAANYSVGEIQKAMEYIVRDWDTIGARFFKNNKSGVVTLGTLYGLHESIFREAVLVDQARAVRTEFKLWMKENPGKMMSVPKTLQDRNKDAKTYLENLGLK